VRHLDRLTRRYLKGESRASAPSRMRTVIKNLLVILALIALAIYFARLFPKMQTGMDFANLYIAAQIVLQGHGHQLYDPALQHKFQVRYFGGAGTYFVHPPFETLVYLPFSLLAPARAYLAWCLFKMLLLIAMARKLAQSVLANWNWRALLAPALLFVPVLLDFLHGQDSLLLLFFLVSAFAALENRKDFAAGCFLGCGLFKFHLVLALAIFVLLSGRKKVLAGFTSVAAILLLISVAISGWGFLVSYPRFLAYFSHLPLAGVSNQQMANLRGLFGLAFRGRAPAALGLTVFSSLLVLGLAASQWIGSVRRGSHAVGLAFANVLIAAILASYHVSPHDLSILLLPMALIVHHLLICRDIPHRTRTVFVATLGILLLPPLYLILLRVHIYTYACIPILGLFGVTYAEIRRLSISS
jgi:Glycosyltransferase family 87